MTEFKELAPGDAKGYGLAGLQVNIIRTTDAAVLIHHNNQETWFAKKTLRIKAGRLYAPLPVIAGKRAHERQQRTTDCEDSETK